MTIADLLRLFALAACWGLAFVFISVAVPPLGPVALVEVRAIVACALLYAYMRYTGVTLDFSGRWRIYLVSGAIGSALPFTLIAAAQTVQSVSYSVILISAAPLLSALVAAAIQDERLTWRRAAGLLLGVAGVVILTGWDPAEAGLPPLWAVGLTLAAATAYAIAGVYARRYMTGMAPQAAATGSQLSSALILAPLVLFFPPLATPSPLVLLNVLALALFSSALAFVLYFRLIASIGTVRTLSVNYLMPLFGVGGGVLILDEPLTANVIAGALVIFAGLALILGAKPGTRA